MKINDFNIIQYNERKNVYFDKKHYYWFNDDFFVVSDAKPIVDSNIYLRRTKLATLAGLKVIESMILDILVHLYLLTMALMLH